MNFLDDLSDLCSVALDADFVKGEVHSMMLEIVMDIEREDRARRKSQIDRQSHQERLGEIVVVDVEVLYNFLIGEVCVLVAEENDGDDYCNEGEDATDGCGFRNMADWAG